MQIAANDRPAINAHTFRCLPIMLGHASIRWAPAGDPRWRTQISPGRSARILNGFYCPLFSHRDIQTDRRTVVFDSCIGPPTPLGLVAHCRCNDPSWYIVGKYERAARYRAIAGAQHFGVAGGWHEQQTCGDDLFGAGDANRYWRHKTEHCNEAVDGAEHDNPKRQQRPHTRSE